MGIKSPLDFDAAKLALILPKFRPASNVFRLDRDFLGLDFLEARPDGSFDKFDFTGVCTAFEVHTGAQHDGYNLTGQINTGSLKIRVDDPDAVKRYLKQDIRITYWNEPLLVGYISRIDTKYDSKRGIFWCTLQVTQDRSILETKLPEFNWNGEFSLSTFLTFLLFYHKIGEIIPLGDPKKAMVALPRGSRDLTVAKVLDSVAAQHRCNWWNNAEGQVYIQLRDYAENKDTTVNRYFVLPASESVEETRQNLDNLGYIECISRDWIEYDTTVKSVSKLSITYPAFADDASGTETVSIPNKNAVGNDGVETRVSIAKRLANRASLDTDLEWAQIVRYYMLPPAVSEIRTIRLPYFRPFSRLTKRSVIYDRGRVYNARVCKQHWSITPFKQKTTYELYKEQ